MILFSLPDTDIPAFIIAALAGLNCGLCGAILLLKRQTMVADALSHSILPGLALAFIVTQVIHPGIMLSGAFISCASAALLIHAIRTTRIINNAAAMGIVLSAFFALGIVFLETMIDGRVHLDAEHALYGALELSYWPDAGKMRTIPPTIIALGVIAVLQIVYIFTFYPRIRLQLSDPEFAASIGLNARISNIIMTTITIFVTVACFEAVGVILVLALIACPAACAHMLSDRLHIHIALSAVIGALCGITGYYAGAILPIQLGFPASINAAGAIALMAGFALIICVLFAPHYGIYGRIKTRNIRSS